MLLQQHLQQKQIEALKAGWIEDRAILDYIELVEGYDYGAHVVLSDDERSDAKDSLAAEHPELFESSDHIREATKMVLTREQRAALELVCDLADEYECKYASTADEQSNAIDTVRALLQEVRL